jgi:hypothetical protein
MMTLAMILGVCSLLVSPLGATPEMRASLVFQAGQTQQDAPQSDHQNPAQAPEQKIEPAPLQTQPPASPPPVKPAPSAQHPKTKTAVASRTTTKKHLRKKKVVAPPTEGPTKVIVRNGGAPDPTVQLSPGVSPEAASRQRQSTTLLLSTTENNLKIAAGRPLTPSQQDTVTQIREYMKQAKTSADAGDLQRARNLAFKAKLLSDELAKH